MLQHVAIIMDGNGRWAGNRKLPRAEGHRQGAEAARTAVKSCIELGIAHLTLYAFSSENWKRPEAEISDLMNLLRFYLGRELDELHKAGVKLNVIGDRSRLDNDLRKQIEASEERTSGNTRLNLHIALSYGSQQEITAAALKLAEDIQAGRVKDVTPETFGAYLYTTGTPDPDLLIRTGGEQRLSNFLLWQCAYAELYFTETLWPDFGAEDLKKAAAEFASRERRYGMTTEQVAV